MFSRFDRVPACDRRTDRQTDRQTDVQPISITCFSIADARKNGVVRTLYAISNLVKHMVATNLENLEKSGNLKVVREKYRKIG